jgi:methylated-DNA-[protein]-cysteine S-methyltransferase
MTTRHDELIALLLGDAPASPRLRRWLATAAGRRELAAHREALGAVDALWARVPRPIAYGSLATPIGRVLVAAGAAGIVRISFRRSEADFAAELRRRFGAVAVRDPARIAGAVRALRAYFAGERRAFDVPVDLSALTPFQRRVLLATATVPAGQVVSYGEIARRIGQPLGSRAVGQALGHNPIPIVIPCHRVIGGGGRIGGYTGGLDVKRTLLRLEGARVAVG